MTKTQDRRALERYFASIEAALSGLRRFLDGDGSPLSGHALVAQSLVPYLERLSGSFACWKHRTHYSDRFSIARSESGFPVFQNTLELANDQRNAKQRLAAIPEADALRADMVDFILRQKEKPDALRKAMAERLYLEAVQDGSVFLPHILPETIKLSVNPKTKRPYYLTHWGAFDGASALPMVYSVLVEDSTPDMVKTLVTENGQLNYTVEVPLPVGGLLNPELARQFDSFAEANCAYSLSPVTIATTMDEEFPTLHPKRLRRLVLGPFYSAGITEHNATVNAILDRVGSPDHAWLLTWTVQDVYSISERPGRKGLWSSQPPRENFHIETGDLEAVQMGVSSYEKHALVPHEAYQALYAAGEADRFFAGYKVHIISHGSIVTNM